MDVLSEVLRAVKLEGAIFFNAEFSAPWCIKEARGEALAPHLSPGAKKLILFHFLTEGKAYARLADGRREELVAGDIVVFPHGDEHFLGNGFPEKPVDSLNAFSKNLKDGLKVAKFGGGGEVTRFVCGFLVCDPSLSQVFLSGLPSLLKVHVVAQDPNQWLEHSIRFSAIQEDDSSAGSGLIVAKLAELLFIETLRRYISSLPPEEIGWLAGARDPVIGQALALLHKEPARAWTISNLARQVGLSRTRLAERFRFFLGESPIAYLMKWRLKLAAGILQSTDDSVAEVAATVGYETEAGFNRAFKREFATPPAQFRRQRRGRANLIRPRLSSPTKTATS